MPDIWVQEIRLLMTGADKEGGMTPEMALHKALHVHGLRNSRFTVDVSSRLDQCSHFPCCRVRQRMLLAPMDKAHSIRWRASRGSGVDCAGLRRGVQSASWRSTTETLWFH